jgi:hypothetical protein
MNNAVDGQHLDAADVAREFLRRKGLDQQPGESERD